jgi:citrate lyase gamma subunit
MSVGTTARWRPVQPDNVIVWSGMANLASGIWRDGNTIVAVVVQNTVDPTHQEWDEWVATIRQGLAQAGVTGGALAITDGGAPNSVQRSKINALVKDFSSRDLRSAVVSSSLVLRGVVGTFRLFTRNTACFGPRDIVAAMDFIQLNEVQRHFIWRKILALDEQITPHSRDVELAGKTLARVKP